MNKPSPIKIAVISSITLILLPIWGYTIFHQTSLERTIKLLVVIAFLIALSVWFYFKSVASATQSYQNLFDVSPLAIYIMAKDSLKILAVNKAMIALYGYTEKEFTSMTVKGSMEK